MKKILIQANDAGQRLDKFLSKLFKTTSLGTIYKWLRKKRVKINGKKPENSYKLQINDIISLYINDEFFPPDFVDFDELDNLPNKSSVTSEINTADSISRLKNRGVKIVYQDENIMVINKRSGINSHGGENSALSAATDYLTEIGEYSRLDNFTFSPSLCNRIDRNTEGLIIIAKNAAALREMNRRVKNRELRKFYILKAEGFFDIKEGFIEGYLVNDEFRNITLFHKEKVKGSKYSRTNYKVISEENGCSMVEAELITGRKHQIRAHFAGIGHPLVGDVKYGAKLNGKKDYQNLCAYKIKFEFTENGLLSYLNKRTFSI